MKFALILLVSLATFAAAAQSRCEDLFGDVRYGKVTLSRELPNKKDLRVGFYFGTFDPIHEDHVAVMLAGLAQAHLDVVIAIPNFLTGHKPNATSREHRLEMARQRVADLPQVVIMTDDGNLSPGDKQAPVRALEDVIHPAWATLIVGEDSFLSLIQFQPLSSLKEDEVLVFRRGEDPITAPEFHDPKVRLTELPNNRGLSSSAIKMMIANGQTPPDWMLHPRVSGYAREHGLYQLQ